MLYRPSLVQKMLRLREIHKHDARPPDLWELRRMAEAQEFIARYEREHPTVYKCV